MSENKENQRLQNVPNPANSLEPMTQKQIFMKLLSQSEMQNRLMKVAKSSKTSFYKLHKMLLNKLCEGSLTWNGVIVISYGIINFGSVFYYPSFNFTGNFHKAILATHQHVVLPDTNLFEPEDKEFYNNLQKGLLVIPSNKGFIFIGDSGAKPNQEWNADANQKKIDSAKAGRALQFNTILSIARQCEAVGTPEMLSVANDCYGWLETKNFGLAKCVQVLHQKKEWKVVMELCTPRLMAYLKEEHRKFFEGYRADAEQQIQQESLKQEQEV